MQWGNKPNSESANIWVRTGRCQKVHNYLHYSPSVRFWLIPIEAVCMVWKTKATYSVLLTFHAHGNLFIPIKLTDYSRNILHSLSQLLSFYYCGNNFHKPTSLKKLLCTMLVWMPWGSSNSSEHSFLYKFYSPIFHQKAWPVTLWCDYMWTLLGSSL